jgi:hypothetical protein
VIGQIDPTNPSTRHFFARKVLMTYLYQAVRAWLDDWFLDRWVPLKSWTESKWQALKAKAAAAWKKLRARNTGDTDGSE